jgi:RNA polymerase sigma-70 factor (family 1)
MIPNTDENKLLVEAIARGDQKAFQKLFDKYHNPIFLSSLKVLKSPDLSKEVVQEIFVKLWNHREKLNSDLCIVAFLYKVSSNHILNILKKASREASLKREIFYHSSRLSNSTDDTILFDEYEKIAKDAITQLPPQRKLIFELCKMEGKSYQEVAEILGISKGTVKDHMIKAAKSIKKYVQSNADLAISILSISMIL